MIRNTLLIAVALACAAGSAQAQKVGTYSGTADDGTFISFSVDKNGTAGAFRFVNGDVNFQAQCTHPVRTANEGWGFFLGQDIVDGSNDFHSGNDYYDTRGSMHFTGPKTIKGTITSVTAVFTPNGDPPTKAQFCKSAKQAFTLTLQTAPLRNQRPTAAVLEKRIGH
ncbi:MAG TPA: hypothetical protein VG889_19555 [Rhizomicrobium sp.]|nr:hypothetical protein [Rhizomicrobium sp.]